MLTLNILPKEFIHVRFNDQDKDTISPPKEEIWLSLRLHWPVRRRAANRN
jgi:hypothetical protein